MNTEAQKLAMLKQIAWSANRPIRLWLYATGAVGLAVMDLLSGDILRGMVKVFIGFAALAIFEVAGSLYWRR